MSDTEKISELIQTRKEENLHMAAQICKGLAISFETVFFLSLFSEICKCLNTATTSKFGRAINRGEITIGKYLLIREGAFTMKLTHDDSVVIKEELVDGFGAVDMVNFIRRISKQYCN